MGFITERYGLEPDAVAILNGRYKKLKLRESWGCFDAFLKWSAENGYQKYYLLRKRNEELPHSPENSRWLSREEVYKPQVRMRVAGVDWQEEFIRNWNENIHAIAEILNPKPVAEPEKPLRETWKYEHPDLIRRSAERSPR